MGSTPTAPTTRRSFLIDSDPFQRITPTHSSLLHGTLDLNFAMKSRKSMKHFLALPLSLLMTTGATVASDKKEETKPDGRDSGYENPWHDCHQPVRRFEGTLGEKGITLLFTEREHRLNPDHRKYDAAYHTHESGIPIELAYQVEENDDDPSQPLVFHELQDQGGTWRIDCTENGASGTWTSKDGKSAMPIALKESYPPGSVKVNRLRLDFACIEEIGQLRRGKQMGVTLLSVPDGGNEALGTRLAILARDSINPDRQVAASPEALSSYIREQVLKTERTEKYAISRYNKDFTLRMNESGFLTVEESSHVHEGGAHGYGFSRFWNLDIATGKSVELADFVNPGREEKWASLGRAAILEQRGLQPGSSLVKAGLHEDHLELNTTWFLVPGGIGFRYAPYEIASYAMGEFEFILPWKDIFEDLKQGTKVHGIAQGFVSRQ